MNSTVNIKHDTPAKLPVRVFSTAAGVLLGAFFCVLNVIIALKTGLGFGSAQVVALLGYAILKAFRIYSKTENNIILAAASGGCLSMFAIDSAVAAGVIYTKASLPVWMIFGIGLLATTAGTILSYYLERFYITEEKLPFPGAVAIAEMIDSLSDTSSRRLRHLITGMIIALIVNIPVQIFQWVPSALPGRLFGNIPSFLGLVLSTMMFGLGYMISWKASLTVLAGSVVSYLVWAFDEGAAANITYSQHANNMWILTLGTSIMIMSAVLNLWGIKSMWSKAFKGTANFINLKAGSTRQSVGFSKIMLILSVLLTFAIFYGLHPSYRTLLVCVLALIPMTVIGILFSCRSSGETGLAPITPLGIITFCITALFLGDFQVIIYAGAFVCATGLAATTMINSLKVANDLGTPREDVLKSQLIGGVFGVLVGSLTIYAIGNIYIFGSENLPTPVSISWGTIVGAMSNGQIPKNMNLFLGAAGAITASILTKFKISSICFGIGIMIPPSYSLTLFLGGLYRYITERRYKNKKDKLAVKLNVDQSVMSGLIAGEGLVILASFILRLLGHS